MSINQTRKPGSLTQAQHLIHVFQTNGLVKSSFYPRIDKVTLIVELQATLNDPQRIDQGRTSLCGPASFLYSLVNTRPDLYVQLIIDLYQTGKVKIGQLTLEPSPGAGKYEILSSDNLRGVDWIALSGLKHYYNNPSQEMAGITLPGTIADWFEKSGFKSVEDRTNLFSPKGINSFLEICRAQQDLDSGYMICMAVHAEIFPYGQSPIQITPDHWVVLTSPVQIAVWDTDMDMLRPYEYLTEPLARSLKRDLEKQQDAAEERARMYGEQPETINCKHRIQFEVFSWGDEQTPVRENKVSSHEATLCYFLRHFYGYIKAKL